MTTRGMMVRMTGGRWLSSVAGGPQGPYSNFMPPATSFFIILLM